MASKLLHAQALVDAIQNENFRLVSTLLDEGASPNLILPAEGVSPFHLAVGSESRRALQLITLFLEHEGNPNVRSTEGLTPVHVAASWGRFQALEVLLWNGGDPSVVDEEGNTPIAMAEANSNWDCINLLENWIRSQSAGEEVGEEDEGGGGESEWGEEENGCGKGDADIQRTVGSEQNEQYLCARHHLTDSYGVKYAASPRSCSHVMLPNQSPDKRSPFTSGAPWSPYSATSSTLSSMGDLGSPGRSMTDGADFDDDEGDDEVSFPFKRLSTPSTVCSAVNSLTSSYDENSLNRAMESICLDNCSVLSTRDAQSTSNSPRLSAISCTENSHYVALDNMYAADQHFEDVNLNNNSLDTTPKEDLTCVSSSQSNDWNDSNQSSELFCGGFGLDVTSPDHTILFSKNKDKDRRRTVANALRFSVSHGLDEDSDESEEEEESNIQDSGCDNHQAQDVQGSTYHVDQASHGLDEQYGESDQPDVEDWSSVQETGCDSQQSHVPGSTHLEDQASHGLDEQYGESDQPDVEEWSIVQDTGCDNQQSHVPGSAHHVDQASYGLDEQYGESDQPDVEDWSSVQETGCAYHQNPGVQGSVHCEHLSEDIRSDQGQSSQEDEESLAQGSQSESSFPGEISKCSEPQYATAQPESEADLHPLSGSSEDSSAYHTAVSPNASMCSSTTSNSIYRNRKSGVMLVEDHFPSASGSEPSLLDFSILSMDETIVYDWTSFRAQEEEETPAKVIPPELAKLTNGEIMSKLRDFGEDAGPVTATTRSVYLNLLMRLVKDGGSGERRPKKDTTNNFQYELAEVVSGTKPLPDAGHLESQMVGPFQRPDPQRKWREGKLKSSFNYLLLDPRVTRDLPSRYPKLTKLETFKTFASAIFYVGKGKRSRPYAHFEEALDHQKKLKAKKPGKKVLHILDIWAGGMGVVSLHCFQNVIPVEAYTREACMIDAIGLTRLTNAKRGDYYGVAHSWSGGKKRQVGVHLLSKACQIFLMEGERQIRSADIASGQ